MRTKGLLISLIRINIFVVALITLKSVKRAYNFLEKIRNTRKSIQGENKIRNLKRKNGRFFWSINLPGWPSRAFNRFVRQEINRVYDHSRDKLILSTVLFEITRKCSLKCRHCSNSSFGTPKTKTEEQTLLNICQRIYETGIPHIQFTGGEPLEAYDTLIKSIKQVSGIDTWLLTSGVGLTRQRSKELKVAGLTGVSISLDHWDRKEHDRFRGMEGVYNQAVQAVEFCNETGLTTALSICATKEFTTMTNLDRYMNMAKKLEVDFVRLLEPKLSGRFAGTDSRLTREQVLLLEQFYNNYENGYSKGDPLLMYPDILNRNECLGKGERYLYILGNGDVTSCPFDETVCGNFLVNTPGEIKKKLEGLNCIECNRYIENVAIA